MTPPTEPMLTPVEKTALQGEIEAIRDRIMRNLGPLELCYIRRIIRVQRAAELTGRTTLFLGFNPIAWVTGVLLLSLSKILENMEIGHNVMHGQYNWTKDPRLEGKTYEWDTVCPREQWRHAHNFMHHTYTNVMGKDIDLGYGIIRVAAHQKWHPAHLLQPLYTPLLAVLFEWGVAFYDLLYRIESYDDLVRKIKGKDEDFRRNTDHIWRKIGRQTLKDYVLFPLLSGPFFLYIMAGNAVANVIRNIWACTIIFCGHFTGKVGMYTESVLENEAKADWYIRQIQSSSNVTGPPLFHIMAGNLSHQIEHHLFPDMPSVHYAEIAPEVRAICEKHGIRYNTGPFFRQVGQVAKRILKYALPTGQDQSTRAELAS